MDELLAEFVAETREMLEAIEGEIIAWEADPSDRARLDAIFRFVHTVKGNCGFFDFPQLASLSHAAEDALADCRAGRRAPDSAFVNAVLAILDRISQMVDAIEKEEDLPGGDDEKLVAALSPGGGNDDASAIGDGNTAEGDDSPEEFDESDAGMPGPNQPASVPSVQRTIRLPVELLDRVMSGVSDMVLARNDLAHRLRKAGNQPTIDSPFERLTSILSDVRDAITRMRMQRIETLYNALPRLVRDLSAELDKQVDIVMEGGDVELDREMIEMIRDPVTHIIRNAIGHGIEPVADRIARGKREAGLVTIAARQSGNTISIVVGDDGHGLDEERIAQKAVASGLISASRRAAMDREAIFQLIFQPGFSTAEEVSNVSGRGVGLDVVRDNLERIGGGIKVSSTVGVGTLFTLQIPLTLSIIPGLTLGIGSQRFAIPQSYIEEIIHASSRSLDFTHVGESAFVTFRGNRVPCLMLDEVLGLDEAGTSWSERTLVMLRLASGDLFALGVDHIHSHGDVVVKPLAPLVARSGLYAGTTLLDDGQPVLLLDVTNIAARHRLVSPAGTRNLAAAEETVDSAVSDAPRAMLFTDHDGRRCAIRLELVTRIERAEANVIDLSGESPHAVIDGEILPVIGLPDGPLPSEKLRFLRLFDGACELLFAVREIDNAVQLFETLHPEPGDPTIEALTLVEGRTVALLDGYALFARHGHPPEAGNKAWCRLPETDWAQSFLAPLVQSAGYRVVNGTDYREAVAIRFDSDADTDWAEPGETPPVIVLRERPDAPEGSQTIYRYDREGLLRALDQASKARIDAGGQS